MKKLKIEKKGNVKISKMSLKTKNNVLHISLHDSRQILPNIRNRQKKCQFQLPINPKERIFIHVRNWKLFIMYKEEENQWIN